jgi:predicted RNase H-like HicB family nuclease
MAFERILVVRAEWDDEAKVWVATSDDVPGLVTEADTVEELEAKLKIMIPELLDLNGVSHGDEIPMSLVAMRRENIRLQA